MKQELHLGLDIGTTTLSCVVVNGQNGEVLESFTKKSGADIPTGDPLEKCQSPERIEGIALGMLQRALEKYPQICSIGLTGQMHGILYLNGQGEAVSPLYTWQDRRSESLCPRLRELTGYAVAPGYGLATHCALAEAGQIPETAGMLCAVMDYLGYRLTGTQNRKIHASNAASLGFFSLEKACFDRKALEKAGIRPDFLPAVTWETEPLGTWRGIPVSVAIGDNQASFLGSVARDESMALANFGTGSQISVLTKDLPREASAGEIEVRPYLKDSWLLCGSALCGGRAYALLENFLRSFAVSCGCPDESRYDVLNALALEGLSQCQPPLVTTAFCGTRKDPDCRGSIQGIGEENFTPAAFAAGTLLGMARELRELLEKMPGVDLRELAVSGNAVRRNPALRQAVEREFGVCTRIPVHQEEAAYGAALFGAAAAGSGEPEQLLHRWIRYA